MDFYQHVFAGNPLDRGEVERRDEDWIADNGPGPGQLFSCPCAAPPCLVNAAATGNGEPALGWLTWPDLEPHVLAASPLLLGMQDGATYFAIDLSGDENAAVALEAMGGYRFEEARAAAENLLSAPGSRNYGPGTCPG